MFEQSITQVSEEYAGTKSRQIYLFVDTYDNPMQCRSKGYQMT